MTELLANHVAGRWQTGGGPGSVLRDPVLGVELVRVDATGLDLGAAFAFARDTGGKALRALSYARRASLLAERLSGRVALWRESGDLALGALPLGLSEARLEASVDDGKVAAAANVVAATANSGMGALFAPGTEKDVGDQKTRVKPEFFDPANKSKLNEVALAFNKEANELAKVAATGDVADAPQVDGDAEVLDVPEALDAFVEYFRNISGEHSDWDEYRQAMLDQGKSLIRITPTRWGPIATGGFPARLAVERHGDARQRRDEQDRQTGGAADQHRLDEVIHRTDRQHAPQHHEDGPALLVLLIQPEGRAAPDQRRTDGNHGQEEGGEAEQHRGRHAGIHRAMQQRFTNLFDGTTIVQRAAYMALELLRALQCRQRGQGNQAASLQR